MASWSFGTVTARTKSMPYLWGHHGSWPVPMPHRAILSPAGVSTTFAPFTGKKTRQNTNFLKSAVCFDMAVAFVNSQLFYQAASFVFVNKQLTRWILIDSLTDQWLSLFFQFKDPRGKRAGQSGAARSHRIPKLLSLSGRQQNRHKQRWHDLVSAFK